MQDILQFIQHHLMLSAALALILVVLIALEFIKIKRGARSLTPSQVVQMMNRQNTPVIDLRSFDTFLLGHIVGAVSIPMSELEAKLKKIEKFKLQPIVLVCGTGIESGRAAATLIKHGFHPQILSGGMQAWRDAEMPVVKGN
jgi:rhodanese-related sulfurtransferase